MHKPPAREHRMYIACTSLVHGVRQGRTSLGGRVLGPGICLARTGTAPNAGFLRYAKDAPSRRGVPAKTKERVQMHPVDSARSLSACQRTYRGQIGAIVTGSLDPLSSPGCALSSVEEHFLHTEGVAGSSPAARTISTYQPHLGGRSLLLDPHASRGNVPADRRENVTTPECAPSWSEWPCLCRA
jgi:hypothetical protein